MSVLRRILPSRTAPAPQRKADESSVRHLLYGERRRGLEVVPMTKPGPRC